MAQQTAVEWLVKEFNLESYKASVEFALQKEKEQMLDAYNSDRYPWSKQNALKYYNETYSNGQKN
jgi:hypothetical protein